MEQAGNKNSNTNFQDIRNYFSQFLDDLIDLRKGVDKKGTIQEIKEKKSMNGANAWMLLCSIVIASIGLDVDSPAVIIGAMLISPLMSPILGMGLAVGINDMETLKKAGTHFAAAMFIAILTATIYFWLSPFDEITSELNARTTPTFLDVFIAFFGGMAGIISIARKDISTTLPGVAIATALMPPLCTVGYGIANANWGVASSAFYLFFLNTFFVSMATFVIVRYLRFPYRQFLNKKEKRRNGIIMFCFAVMVTIPSLFIFKTVYEDYRNKGILKDYLEYKLGEDYDYVDDKVLTRLDDGRLKLMLKVYNNDIINPDLTAQCEEELEERGLKNLDLVILTTSEIKLEDMDQMRAKVGSIEKIAQELEATKIESAVRSKEIDSLRSLKTKGLSDTLNFAAFSEDLKIFYPEIKNVSYSTGYIQNFSQLKPIHHLVIDWYKKPGAESKQKINDYFNSKISGEGTIIHQ